MCILTKMVSGLLLALLLLLAGCGRSTPNSRGAAFDAEKGHPANWLPAGHMVSAQNNLNACRECHGSNLDGGISGVSCTKCHIGDAVHVHILSWGTGTGVVLNHPAYVSANGTGRCSNIYCHGPDLNGNSGPGCTQCHLGDATHVHPSSWGTGAQIDLNHAPYVIANGAGRCANANCHGTDLTGNTGPACSTCHPNGYAASLAQGCSACHDAPPTTGTHLIHYSSLPLVSLVYGDITINSTDDAYRFGCGNCHPLDPAKHDNGTVDVELYNASAPAGSLKAKNPSSAAYQPGQTRTTYANKISGGRSLSYSSGTCSNVYCHSGYTIISGPVGTPVLDSNGNPIYDPYTVTYSRVYKTTPAWGTSGAFTTCRECHEFPLTTSDPSVQAGVGDSHQWIDEQGYGNLHAYNMGYDPLSCRTCHYGTVTQPNIWTRDSLDVTIYNPVPLASRKLHVNGSKDVVFDTANSVIYTSTYSLSTASYNPGTKTCSNVACHLEQKSVTWGSPYRWNNSTECNVCHRY